MALLLALAAFAAATVAAVGPTREVRTTYTWPPQTIETSGHSPEGLHTPLLIAHRVPESVTARLPCRTGVRSDARVLVLSTARHPRSAGGLEVDLRRGMLGITIGEQTLGRFPAPQRSSPQCFYGLELTEGRWSITRREPPLTRSGELSAMPVVNGLFTHLPAPAVQSLSVDVRTTPHTTVATSRQKIGWILAALLAATSLTIASDGRVSRRRVGHGLVRRIRGALHPADGVVSASLVAWWILSPSFWDDGWLARSQSNFQHSGGFSTYYTSLGTNHLLGYWLDWLQHLLATRTESLVVLRVPGVLALGLTWIVCRYALGRLPAALAGSSAPLWGMASALLLVGFGWGVTLRPEPFVALLVVGVTACAVAFLESRSAAPLALAVPLIALAVSTHPIGLIAIAPLLAILPALVRWTRTALLSAIAIATSCCALVLTLLALGSDIPHRVSDAATVDEAGDAQVAWFDEIARYDALLDPTYGAPLRRGSVVLMLLTAFAYLLRPRGSRDPLSDVPGRTLVFSLLLLAISPTKLPWHFGALIGVAALAAGFETARLARTECRRLVRSLVALGALVLAIRYSWWPRYHLAEFDLNTLTWHVRFGSHVNIGDVGAAAAVVALWIAGFAAVLRGGHGALRRVGQRATLWIAPLIAAPLLLFTSAVLVADAAVTPSWTLTKQNISSLVGNAGCGIADHLAIPLRESMLPVDSVSARRRGAAPVDALPAAPVPGLPVFALSPGGQREMFTPWFRIPRDRFGFFVDPQRQHVEAVQIEWGYDKGRGVVRTLSRGGTTADLVTELRPDLPRWRLLVDEEFPVRDPRANVVRLGVRSSAGLTVPTAVSGAVTYQTERLSDRLTSSTTPSLVVPNVSHYLPCQRRPILRNGAAEVPGYVIFSYISWPLGIPSSPFDGATDLYSAIRLPLIHSSGEVSSLAVFEFQTNIQNSHQTESPSSFESSP